MNQTTRKIIENTIKLLPNEGVKELNDLIDDENLDDDKIIKLFAKYGIKSEDVKAIIGEKNA